MTENKPIDKKANGALREVLKWGRDLTVVGLLIWYFAVGDHTQQFWSTLSRWFGTSVAVVFKYMPKEKKVPPKPVPTPPVVSHVFVPPPPPKPEQIANQVPGDCFPPEVRSKSDVPPEAKKAFVPSIKKIIAKVRHGVGKPVQFAKKKVAGIPLYVVTLNLNDPDGYIVVRLPKNAKQANSTTFTAGHESFDDFVKHYPAAAMVNGTFFSKDEQERVMGNMVSEGKLLKYSQWENYGTTLSLGPGDRPEMVTAREEGKPNWSDQWFSITCGPRLLKHGEIWDSPDVEGFTDTHVLGIGPRSAIGYPKSGDKLLLVTFLRGLDLKTEAKVMKALGCYEAMNLDGGASKALSHNDKVVMEPSRGLTNVLVVYDSVHKAPESIVTAWEQYQQSKAAQEEKEEHSTMAAAEAVLKDSVTKQTETVKKTSTTTTAQMQPAAKSPANLPKLAK